VGGGVEGASKATTLIERLACFVFVIERLLFFIRKASVTHRKASMAQLRKRGCCLKRFKCCSVLQCFAVGCSFCGSRKGFCGAIEQVRSLSQ